MREITDQGWEGIQSGVNACDHCRSEDLFEQPDPLPGRPWNPARPGRLLFISEASPLSGGFWQIGIKDDLRENLLTLLREQKFQFPPDLHSQAALAAFLSHGFFLVQALKWPLAQGKRRRRPSFNQLGPDQKRRLIQHSVAAHLQGEIELIAPRGILALGNAAWQACGELSQRPLTSENGGVETLRSKDYLAVLPSGSIPLNVTYLPVEQNIRIQERGKAIEEDLIRFLIRHNWGAAQNFP